LKLLRSRSVTVLLLLLSSCAMAQNAARDSMLQVYHSGQHTPKLLNDLCWSYVFNNPDSAIFFGKKALSLSRKLKNVGNEATAFNRMGVAFDVKHMPDSALFFYHQAVTLSEGPGGEPATLAGALNNIGLIHWNLGDHERAVKYYVRSAELFEQLGNMGGLAHTYNNIGLLLSEDGNHQEALRYNRKALRIREELGDRNGMAATYTNFGLIYEELGELDSMIYYTLLSIPIKEELNDAFGLAKSLHNLGYCYQNMKQYEKAEEYFRRSLEVSAKLGNDRAVASTLMHLASVVRLNGRPKEAMPLLDRAEELCKRDRDPKLLWKIYEQKAFNYEKLKDFEAATVFYYLRNTIKDSILTIDKTEAVDELETKYRTAVKDRKIEEQERQVAEASLLAQRRNTYIALLVLLLIILLLFGFSYIQFTRRKADSERDAVIIAEREMGLRAVITATEEERKRIAKDLHDGVVQGLTGLKLRLQNQLRTAKMEKSEKEFFAQTSSLLDESINELRNISHQMMPRALAELGLLPALDDLLEKAFGHTEIRFSFEHHRLDGQRFDERVEISLYRITQELINNIIKHSGAKAVSVQLLKTATHLVLVVEDDGKGFRYEDAANRNGVGLMNISSRTKALNGEVDYSPSPQQGTVATIRIPIA
jgi:signal transduction histidine kinase/Tfp pilus assembly protein PilF